MSEFDPRGPEMAGEFECRRALQNVIEEYFDEHQDFLEGFDLEERVGAVYGMLLEIGEDPDVVMIEAGVFVKEDDDEV